VISEDTIAQVRDRVSIVQLVGERVKLERAGRSFKGLCPFHKEKSPSFHVNEERNFYHCFGCHAHGDSIRFLQEAEGLSFVEAVRDLASRVGIEITETRSDTERRHDQEAKRQLEELYAVSDAAARFFEQCLEQHPLRELAWAELDRRGLIPSDDQPAIGETLRAFRIGYAPYAWDGLGQELKRAGLSHVAAEKVGLLAPRKTGPGHYDRFRHRLMFAVLDLRGRVIAFSGRSLPEPEPSLLAPHGIASMGAGGDDPAKYMNSPESTIYKKRETVFGLYQARNAARQLDECIIVEGNFDVVSLHARGIENVAAPLGTAFTREQARLLRRYSQNVTLLFDADTAGRRASNAAREPAQLEGLLAKVATLPDGTDPDDLVRSKGPDALRACVRSAKGMLEHLIDSTLDSGFAGADPQTQGRKIQEVLELIRAEQDPTVRALAQSHADTIAGRLGIADARSMQALSRAVRQAGSQVRGPADPSPMPERARSKTGHEAIEANVLGTLVEYPSLLAAAEVAPMVESASGALALAIAVLARSPETVAERLDAFPAELRSIVARHLAMPSMDDEATALRVLLDNLTKLALRDRRRIKARIEEELRAARSVGDAALEDELLLELVQLSRAGTRR
jgi:DNA primase